MSKRLEMIAQELEKLRKKRTRMDEQIRELEDKYKETENTEIHEIVHAANLTPEQLAKVLKSLQHSLPQGKIPGKYLAQRIRRKLKTAGRKKTEETRTMKNKKYGKITAMLMAAAVLVRTAVPVYAAENIREVVKNQEMVLEAGTDRVTYRVDTESGTAGSEAVAVPASKETGIPGEAAGQEMQAEDTAETGESAETEKETETDPGLTMTVTVSVEDLLNYLLPEETEPIQTGTVKDCTMLNIRAGAGTENEVIGRLKVGDQVRVTGSDGKWYQITIPEKDGYVYSKYLDVIESASSDPAVSRDELLQILMFVLENMDEEQQPAGLTPDGNMNLVDDIGPVTGEGQQFITMTSKNGNYFYLIIDRDDKGNETVHLLNQVDERDLLDLMEDNEAAYYEEQISEQKQQAADVKAESEKLAEELKEKQAEKDSEGAETGGTDADPETSEEPAAAKETGKSKIILAVILLVALGGCGYWLVKKMKKNKPAKKEVNTPDVDDEGEELAIPVDDTEG